MCLKQHRMPPKRARLLPGQRTLSGAFASSSRQAAATSKKKRGEVESWCNFAERRWKECYAWLDVWVDGIYCRKGTARSASASGSKVFLSKGFTGTRPDVLSRHEGTLVHDAKCENQVVQ